MQIACTIIYVLYECKHRRREFFGSKKVVAQIIQHSKQNTLLVISFAGGNHLSNRIIHTDADIFIIESRAFICYWNGMASRAQMIISLNTLDYYTFGINPSCCCFKSVIILSHQKQLCIESLNILSLGTHAS